LKDLELLRSILNCNTLSANWNYSYGITKSKSKALILNSSHKDSFFNPKPESAETTLTLFILGNIDKWKQNDLIHCQVPRNVKNSNWNKSFFDMIRGNNLCPGNVGTNPLWSELFKKNKMMHEIDFSKSWLLFEFQIMNKAFHSVNGDRFEDLSFLDMKNIDNCGQFDAVLIIPNTHQIIFFEAKLASDISLNTKKYIYINQIIRNLESIFLLTNHKDSLYKNWNSNYVFICPEKVLRYKSKFYSYVLNDIDNQISIYSEILQNEYQNNRNEEADFTSFSKKINDGEFIITKTWNELGELLKKDDKHFFKKYLENLRTLPKGFTNEQIEVLKKRLLTAGIE